MMHVVQILMKRSSYFFIVIVAITVIGLLWLARSKYTTPVKVSTSENLQVNYKHNIKKRLQNLRSTTLTSLKKDVGHHRRIALQPFPTNTTSRLEYIQRQCSLPRPEYFKTQKLYYAGWPALTMYETKKLINCEVPKVGFEFFHVMLKNLTPFHMKNFVNVNEKQYNNFAKIIFVREPFSRLLSGYIDKFFRILKIWFPRASRYSALSRKSFSQPPCGGDITFREFIKGVIYDLETTGTTDHHWMPHTTMCHTCAINYTFVGKMETIRSDVHTFANIIGGTVATTPAKYYYQIYNENNIKSYFSTAFRWNKCLNLSETVEKAWMAQQLRGGISHRLQFPYDSIGQYNHTDFNLFYQNVLEKRESVKVTPDDKSRVKNLVIRAAYSAIDHEDIEKLRRLYYDDFVLYGYNMYPEFLSYDGPMTLDEWEPFKLRYRSK